MLNRQTLLLVLLGSAGLLWLLSRTQRGQDVTGGALEFIDVTASRVKNAVTSRGYRNNNPGNIRFIAKNPWNGQVANDAGYGVYDTPQNGTRALARELLKRANAGFRTVRELIAGKLNARGEREGGWAPSSENDTVAYVADLSAQLDVDPDSPINVSVRLAELARGIAKHENGYLDSTYNFDAWVRL